MKLLAEISESLLHFVFPHTCSGCGTDIVSKESCLCIECLSSLPDTWFHHHAANPIEKKFWGRLPLKAATAQYYFTQGSIVQRLMHELKYKGNKEVGRQLGSIIGGQFLETHRFSSFDAIIPLPLYPSKQRKRGYNQATILCEGIRNVTGFEIFDNAVIRKENTETQTRKSRIERWRNMEGRFEVINNELIAGKDILLVDDIITTGATLESCGNTIIEAGCNSLSIAAFAYSSI